MQTLCQRWDIFTQNWIKIKMTIHQPSLLFYRCRRFSHAVCMNSSLVLVYTAGLIVIVFLSCWPLSVNVCFVWLDAEIAFLCFETAVNLLKTKLFLWQSNFFFLCVWWALNVPLWPSVQSEGEAVEHTPAASQVNIVFGDTRCRCGCVVSESCVASGFSFTFWKVTLSSVILKTSGIAVCLFV